MDAGRGIRMPFSQKLCRDGGVVCGQALLAAADTAMVIARAAAWDGYKPMSAIDQTMHFSAR
jgi:acyl-coenzyme A thioesterase PaaI-like protein